MPHPIPKLSWATIPKTELLRRVKLNAVLSGSDSTAARLFLMEAKTEGNVEALTAALEAVLDVCDATLYHEGNAVEGQEPGGSWVDIDALIREKLAEKLDDSEVGNASE